METNLFKLAQPHLLRLTEDRATFEKYLDSVWEKMKEANPSFTQIEGFRPQAVTRQIAESHWGGRHKLFADTYHSIVQEAVHQLEKRIAGIRSMNAIDDKNPNAPFAMNVVLDLYPTAEVPNIEDIKIEKDWKVTPNPVTDVQIDYLLTQFRQNWGQRKPVTGPVADGNYVNVTLEGFRDGVAVPNTKVENFNLRLGQGSIITSLESAIRGHTPGEEAFKVSASFPDDYHSKDMAGQTLDWEVKINSAFEHYDADDETLFEKNNVKTMDELRASIRSQLEEGAQSQVSSALAQHVLAALIEKTKFEPIPDVMVEQELERDIKTFKLDLASRDQMLNAEQERHLREQRRPNAVLLCQQRIAARSFAEKYNLFHTKEQMVDLINDLATKGVFSQERGQEFIKSLEDKAPNGIWWDIEDMALPLRVADHIWSHFEKAWSEEPKQQVAGSDFEDRLIMRNNS